MPSRRTVTFQKSSPLRSMLRHVKRFFQKKPESHLIAHAKREFLAMGYEPPSSTSPADPNLWIQQNILELLKVFADQGHSGFSASYCIDLFTKLARYEPLCPLSGADDEWVDVGHGLEQNKRCSKVFRQDGKAYNIDGKVFMLPDGGTYTSAESRVYITFPYMPKTEYVEVDL